LRVPIQCHITFMKRVSGEWTRIIDRHPMAITLTMAATVALAVGLTWHLAR